MQPVMVFDNLGLPQAPAPAATPLGTFDVLKRRYEVSIHADTLFDGWAKILGASAMELIAAKHSGRCY